MVLQGVVMVFLGVCYGFTVFHSVARLLLGVARWLLGVVMVLLGGCYGVASCC